MNQDYKNAPEGVTFTVETGQWRAKVVADPSTHTEGPHSLKYVDYDIEFTNGKDCRKMRLSVWMPYFRGGRDLHPFVRDWIECWLEEPELDEVLVVGPPI
jgi:hypothetical protein